MGPCTYPDFLAMDQELSMAKSMRPRLRPRPKPSKPPATLRPRERLLFDALVALRDAEWMVTHDWGGDRKAVLAQVDAAILKTAKACGVDPGEYAPNSDSAGVGNEG